MEIKDGGEEKIDIPWALHTTLLVVCFRAVGCRLSVDANLTVLDGL